MHDMLNILVLRLDCTEAKTTIKKQKKKKENHPEDNIFYNS